MVLCNLPAEGQGGGWELQVAHSSTNQSGDPPPTRSQAIVYSLD